MFFCFDFLLGKIHYGRKKCIVKLNNVAKGIVLFRFLVFALDISLAAACFIHFLTALVCVKKLKFMMYTKDEETTVSLPVCFYSSIVVIKVLISKSKQYS